MSWLDRLRGGFQKTADLGEHPQRQEWPGDERDYRQAEQDVAPQLVRRQPRRGAEYRKTDHAGKHHTR